MLCCTSQPRAFAVVSCTPNVDTRASHECDDVILNQITKEFIKQELFSSSAFFSLIDKVQIKKQLFILVEREM